MTAQIAERLLYQGQTWSMCANPLNDYFAFGGVSAGFRWDCTALWRGYVGLWEIQNDRLYLLELHGTLQDGSAASLATVFPDYPERVFAHWYSGTLRIPQGKLLKYVHMGYGSTYERDLLLDAGAQVAYGGFEGFELGLVRFRDAQLLRFKLTQLFFLALLVEPAQAEAADGQGEQERKEPRVGSWGNGQGCGKGFVGHGGLVRKV